MSVWTPTVLICDSVATVLGNTDLAAGTSDQHLYWLCTGVFWQFLFEKHSMKDCVSCYDYYIVRNPWKYSDICLVTSSGISLVCVCVPLMMSCPEKRRRVICYLCSDWQAAGRRRAGQPLLIGWAPGKGRANAKGTLAPSEAPRWSKLWERGGREEREGERKSEMSSCLSISVSCTADRR